MVFYTRKISKIQSLNNPTIVVLTDRNDLDNQLYETFANTNIIKNTVKNLFTNINLT